MIYKLYGLNLRTHKAFSVDLGWQDDGSYVLMRPIDNRTDSRPPTIQIIKALLDNGEICGIDMETNEKVELTETEINEHNIRG